MSEKITVLIVDDSRIYRSIIEKALSSDHELEIIGSVRNGKKALEFLKTRKPDIITLDVEMDEMDGLETLKEIKNILPLPERNQIGVIMVSARTTRGARETIEALQSGAFDFISKPQASNPIESERALINELIPKIKQFKGKIGSRVISSAPKVDQSVIDRLKKKRTATLSKGTKAIVIGVSTGGPKTLMQLIPELTEKIDIPILIVQHMPEHFTEALANSLNQKSRYTIIEGKDGDKVRERYAYIAPGGKHMVVAKSPLNSEVITKLNTQPPEENCKPSVNVLFRSAAQVFGGNVIAIILTGMGSDGTKGLGPLKRAGAYIIAQDEATSVVWGMPGSAVNSGYVDEVLPVDKITDSVVKLVNS